jgi:hypothetical protein
MFRCPNLRTGESECRKVRCMPGYAVIPFDMLGQDDQAKLYSEIPRMDAVMSVILPPFGFLCKAKPLLLR